MRYKRIANAKKIKRIKTIASIVPFLILFYVRITFVDHISCLFCKKASRIKVLYAANLSNNVSPDNYSARLLPERINYQIVQCIKCSLIFSNPIFPPLKIKKMYQESSCTYKDQIPYLTKTYLELFDKIAHNLPTNPKVLDIGCANGFFLDALKKKGISHVFGVEPSKKIVAMAPKSVKKNITVDIFRKNQFPKNSFDLICLFHLLDHVVNPKETIKDIFNLLKKGGIILLVVHDAEGLSVRVLGKNSPIFDIQHIYLFNKKTLRRIIAEAGFHLRDEFNVTNTFQLYYWITMTPLSKMFKQILLPFLQKSKLALLPIPFSAGNIGILAQK